ncbi:MAG: c-type cytochrome [Phycisphaeraceae bacterium]
MNARHIIIVIALLVCVVAVRAEDDTEQRGKDQIFIETLMRLDIDLDAKPTIKAKLLDVLSRQQGTVTYVELVERFNLRGQSDALFKLALEKPSDSAGVAAAKLLLKFGQASRFVKVITGDDAKAATAAITALGYTNDGKAYALLETIVIDVKRSKPVRTAAVSAMGQGRGGERRLLELAKAGTLSDDLHFAAAQVLMASFDPTTRDEAIKHLKLPPSVSSKPLPPIAQLVKRDGDATKGPEVFKKANCVLCHRVKDMGVDFGPALSEIGDKLPKDALYTAILDPSAAIEHNYSGTRLQTDEGDDIVGIIVSETDSDVQVKIPGGIIRKYAKSSIFERTAVKTSLMPVGLQLAMTEQDLVDLVAWLSTLKKR